ncbi:MAG: type II toxin-antitoxin system RelE/ParE family toxin [Deltaproteobacteria bacterium]|nr:type II toxin-antitoxin system RelE/ParE family toxin [Deltaproteobacteria bacterium]
MNIRFTPRALAEAKRIKDWWVRNRPAAPELFERELAAVLDLIRDIPTVGLLYSRRDEAEIRWALLPRTRDHVYYTVASDEAAVLSVWGVRRQRGPKL